MAPPLTGAVSSSSCSSSQISSSYAYLQFIKSFRGNSRCTLDNNHTQFRGGRLTQRERYDRREPRLRLVLTTFRVLAEGTSAKRTKEKRERERERREWDCNEWLMQLSIAGVNCVRNAWRNTYRIFRSLRRTMVRDFNTASLRYFLWTSS